MKKRPQKTADVLRSGALAEPPFPLGVSDFRDQRVDFSLRSAECAEAVVVCTQVVPSKRFGTHTQKALENDGEKRRGLAS